MWEVHRAIGDGEENEDEDHREKEGKGEEVHLGEIVKEGSVEEDGGRT